MKDRSDLRYSYSHSSDPFVYVQSDSKGLTHTMLNSQDSFERANRKSLGPRINSTDTRLRLLLLSKILVSTDYIKYIAKGASENAFVYEACVSSFGMKNFFPWKKAVRILLNLQHRNILPYLAIERREHNIYVAERCTEFRTVQTLLDDTKATQRYVKESIVWELIYHILTGLAYLHLYARDTIPWADTIIHGSIIPKNIVLLDDEVAVLGGCALWYLFPTYHFDIYATSTYHAAPEVIVDVNNMNPASDVWSVGCIIYELIALKPLVGDKVEKDIDSLLRTLHARTSSISSALHGYSEELIELLSAMLQMNPQQRPAVNELLNKRELLYAKYRASRINESLAYTSMRSAVLSAGTGESLINTIDQNFTVTCGNIILLTESRRIDLIRVNSRGETQLMLAVQKNDCNMMINHIAEEAGVQAADGMTALMFAALFNNSLAITYLIDKEARIVDDDGNSALIFAVQSNFPHCAKLLAPREWGITNNAGETALMYAVHGRCLSMIDYLSHKERGIQAKNGDTALILAIRANYYDGVRILAPIEKYISLPDGTTPEKLALLLGFHDIASLINMSPS